MAHLSSIKDCRIIDLKKIHNPAGNMTVIQNNDGIPFDVRRVYYLYDIPGGSERGGHAHRELYQLIVAASGSFTVKIDDGKNNSLLTLRRPDTGLIVVPGIWRELIDFSSGAVCLVLASALYNEKDYIRNYDDFLIMKG